jgi:hypothetical protein
MMGLAGLLLMSATEREGEMHPPPSFERRDPADLVGILLRPPAAPPYCRKGSRR